MFNKHQKAISLSGTPYISPIEGGRGYADGETIPFVETDWSTENLEAVVAMSPGQESLATFSVNVTTEQQSWRHYKEVVCVPSHFFDDIKDLDEMVTVSLVTISWTANNLSNLPKADVQGEPVCLYLEIRREDGSGPRFAAGDFVLTERVE